MIEKRLGNGQFANDRTIGEREVSSFGRRQHKFDTNQIALFEYLLWARGPGKEGGAEGTVNVSEIRINICGRSRPSGWLCSFLLSSLSFSQYLWHLSLPFLPNYFWRSCSAGGREHLPSLRRMKCEMRISLISSTRHRRHPSCSCIWTRVDMISISPLSSPPIARPRHLS